MRVSKLIPSCPFISSDGAIQAASAQLRHWLAHGVPSHGSAAHRLRERRVRGVHAPPHPHHPFLQHQLLHPDHQGTLTLPVCDVCIHHACSTVVFSLSCDAGRRKHAACSCSWSGAHAALLLPEGRSQGYAPSPLSPSLLCMIFFFQCIA